MKPFYAVVLGLQEAEITKHCFGDCGKAILAAMHDEELGPLIPCAQSECPHLSMQTDEPMWHNNDGRPVYLRKLVPLRPVPCGCRLGECESKTGSICRMEVEIKEGEAG